MDSVFTPHLRFADELLIPIAEIEAAQQQVEDSATAAIMAAIEEETQGLLQRVEQALLDGDVGAINMARWPLAGRLARAIVGLWGGGFDAGARQGLEEMRAAVEEVRSFVHRFALADDARRVLTLEPQQLVNSDAVDAVVGRANLLAGDFSDDVFTRLKGDLTAAIVPQPGTGEPIARPELLRRIQSTLGVAKGRATTIARTETTYAYNTGRMASFNDSELVDYVRVIAIRDRRTSDVCQSRDGLVVPKGELATIGGPPPWHYRCRTTIGAVMSQLSRFKAMVADPANDPANRAIAPLPKGWRTTGEAIKSEASGRVTAQTEPKAIKANIMSPIDRRAPGAAQQAEKRQQQVGKLYDKLATGRLKPGDGDDDRTVKGKMGALNALSDAQNPKVGLAATRNDAGEYTGFLSFKAGRREVEIENLGTDGTQPGSGRALFRQVAEYAAREGKGLVVAPVPDAIGFYERMGMRKVSEGALELSPEEVQALIQGKAAQQSQGSKKDVQFDSWTDRPGPQAASGIITRAKRRKAMMDTELPIIDQELDRLDSVIEDHRVRYDEFRANNPGLSREERLNSPIAKEGEKLYAERTELEKRIEKISNDGTASEGILAGVGSIPAKIRSTLEKRDRAVRKDAAEAQAEIKRLELEIALSIDRDGFGGGDVEGRIARRSRMNELITENKLRFGDKDGIAAMADLRDQLLRRGTGQVVNPSFDLPSRLKPLQQDFADTFNEFVQLTNGRGGRSLKKVAYTGDRASASQNGYLNVGASSNGVDRPVMFHEMGHHVEFESKTLRDRANAIIRSRSTAEAPQQLPGYEKGEVAFPNHWSSAYTAKSYSDKSTEVYSMGLQHFTSPQDMWRLYLEDKEHFFITMGIFADD
ncbi:MULTISPECIES: minor capsid protein [Cyanophyceae]|uniref:minor capsid protein n=1 Tax=Cyanophyceae TaxID=3028117 RepID=UPI001A7EFB73|nr:minor capsid protein [Nodosilinea sp. FACHB-131]